MMAFLPFSPMRIVLALFCAGLVSVQAQTKSKETGKSPAERGAPGAVGPAVVLPKVYAPTRPRQVAPRFPWKKEIVTTIFWIGEAPTAGNPTPNHKSSWDTEWQKNFGGFDDPSRDNRTWDFRPKNFVPNLNPFYVALPFNDLTNKEMARAKIPWYSKRMDPLSGSACRGIWIAIRSGNKTCFAQWEDCGPFNTDDHNYVFGTAPPKNQSNNGAGLDVSPAVRDFLGISSGMRCDWRFCAVDEVPDGPWTRYGLNNNFVQKTAADRAKIKARYEELVRSRKSYIESRKKAD